MPHHIFVNLMTYTLSIPLGIYNGSGPPFRKVRLSESRHSWSLHGIVLDIATTRRLTLTLTLTVSRPNRKLSLLEMAENGGPFGVAAPRNGGPTPLQHTTASCSYFYALICLIHCAWICIIFYASANVARLEALYFQAVHASLHPSVHLSRTLLTYYLEK